MALALEKLLKGSYAPSISKLVVNDERMSEARPLFEPWGLCCVFPLLL